MDCFVFIVVLVIVIFSSFFIAKNTFQFYIFCAILINTHMQLKNSSKYVGTVQKLLELQVETQVSPGCV